MTVLLYSHGKPADLGAQFHQGLVNLGFVPDIIPRPKFWRDKPADQQWPLFKEQVELLMVEYGITEPTQICIDYEKFNRLPGDYDQRHDLLMRSLAEFTDVPLGMYNVPHWDVPVLDKLAQVQTLDMAGMYMDDRWDLSWAYGMMTGLSGRTKPRAVYVGCALYGTSPLQMLSWPVFQRYVEDVERFIRPDHICLWLGELTKGSLFNPPMSDHQLEEHYLLAAAKIRDIFE